jgi:hypothetical protein
VNSVAAPTSAQPLYTHFLARVIDIEAVQCHRAAVTDEGMECFFSEGRLPGAALVEFLWCLDGSAVPLLYLTSVSLPMQHARDAAMAAFTDFIGTIVNRELIASGVHPATGLRRDLDPAELTRTHLVLDVRNGDLFEAMLHYSVLRWSTITLRTAEPGGAAEPVRIPERKLGRIDWDDWWKHETARREQGSLPNEKGYSRQTAPLIIARYGVTSVDGGDLRRFKVALYRGDLERPKRTRPKHKG